MNYVLGFALFFFGVLFLGLVFYLIKRQRLMYTQAMFRRYNESEDLQVIINWIKARRSSLRLLEAFEYLVKIKESDLALEVYRAFPFDQYKTRHIRVFACKAFTEKGHREEALELARRLLQAYPNDDSILDLYIDVHLQFDETEEVRAKLEPRLLRKFKGTIFARHKARLLAAEGEYDQAIAIMKKIVDRDLVLARNTFAQPQKQLQSQQYQESQALLDELEEKAAAQK